MAVIVLQLPQIFDAVLYFLKHDTLITSVNYVSAIAMESATNGIVNDYSLFING